MTELGFIAKLFVNSRLMWLFHSFFGVSRLLGLVNFEPKRIIPRTKGKAAISE